LRIDGFKSGCPLASAAAARSVPFIALRRVSIDCN
jgi:hypothetical protein